DARPASPDESSAAPPDAGSSATPASPVSLVPPPAPEAESAAVGVPGAPLREVSVDDVVPNPKQPRQVFDDEALEELTHSVREFGLLQPIVVREDGGGRSEPAMGGVA